VLANEPAQRPPVCRPQTGVELHLPCPRRHDELGPGLARGALHGFEPFVGRQLPDSRAERGGEEFGTRRGMLVARGRHVGHAEEPDGESHREAQHHDDRGGQWQERPGAPIAGKTSVGKDRGRTPPSSGCN